MRRHPSFQSRLIRDARYQQQTDDYWRTLAEVDLFMGGPVVPESLEVRQERLDREACALASSNAAPRPKPESPVVAAVKAFGAGMAVFGTIWVMGLAGQFAGGWPL